jgi:methyltransferase OMS1, mitochondrial
VHHIVFVAVMTAPTPSLASKLRYVVYIGASSTVFGSATYLAYHSQLMEKQFEERKRQLNVDIDPSTSSSSPSSSFSFVNNPQRNDQYSKVATCYDMAIGRDEFYMGINFIRRLLLYWYAKGTVLEVGAGTGRNIPYYTHPKIQRVVLVDTCQEMLEQAREKVTSKRNTKNQPQFAFVQGDSANLKQLPDHAFDTVIDTFGLCSYNDPVAVVQEMIRKCKKDGTIILLEHGRSKSWNIITKHLDRHAEQHAANWGCVWNRDIDAIIDEVTTGSTNLSNDKDNDIYTMEIIQFHKFHFGTTYLIVARPVKRSN